MTEREFYEKVAAARDEIGGVDDLYAWALCPFCESSYHRSREMESFEELARKITHDSDCPVLYARARLEELDNEPS